MEKNYLKGLFLSMMLGVCSGAMADNYYVSSTGNDANDGKTAATAFATLNKAVETAIDGDVIKVSGKITVTETITLNEFGALTIEGTSSDNDKIDGAKKVRLFNVTNTDLTLRNLTLRRGKASEDKNARGAALMVTGKSVTIDHCVFEKNETPYRSEDNGGAIFYNTGTLTVTNSSFESNIAYRGGAIEAQFSTVKIASCKFKKNLTMAAEGSNTGSASGGAVALGNCWSDLTYDEFTTNQAAGRGGALNIWNSNNERNIDKYCTVKSCAIVENTAGSPGGAIYLSISQNFQMNVLATTIANNTTSGAGGVMYVDNSASSNDTQSINFVNCTMTGNYTASNMGNSGGLCLTGGNDGLRTKVNIVNTILEGNYAAGQNNSWADARFARNGNPDNVTVVNSIIGNAFRDANDGELTNVTNSLINITGSNSANELTAGLGEITDNCFPLKADAQSLTMGSVETAAQYGCDADQKGQAWTQPYIGAVQLKVGDAIPAVPEATGIKTVTTMTTTVKDNAYYTLQGIRVEKPAKGIYIHQGKKIVIR